MQSPSSKYDAIIIIVYDAIIIMMKIIIIVYDAIIIMITISIICVWCNHHHYDNQHHPKLSVRLSPFFTCIVHSRNDGVGHTAKTKSSRPEGPQTSSVIYFLKAMANSFQTIISKVIFPNCILPKCNFPNCFLQSVLGLPIF